MSIIIEYQLVEPIIRLKNVPNFKRILNTLPFRACGALPFRYAPVTVGSGRVGFTSEYAYPLDSIKEGADEPVANDTCDVTYESNPGDVLHIPAEGNLLQAHYYHTSGTTDNQH